MSRGKLCRKCATGYNGAFLDPQMRLTTPLRRANVNVLNAGAKADMGERSAVHGVEVTVTAADSV